MVLAEFSERNEADLALWLFFIALFVLDLKIWLKKRVLGTVSVIAFRLAALLVPSTEAAMRKESVIYDCARSIFDFLGVLSLMLESSFMFLI